MALLIGVGILPAVDTWGLGAHELVVVANRREPDSVAIAESYRKLRQIPSVNLVLVDVPASSGDAYHTIDRDAFTRLIWEPVQEAIRERGLTHVLAWVYSTHIPYRVESQPPVSVQGLTFMRNQMADAADIRAGRYASKLFVGPDSPTANGYGPQSLYPTWQLLREEMPIPSMALGYIGPRGNTKEEVLAMLARSVSADSTAPDGTVYFVQQDDVRSRAREWQFATAVPGLQRLGVRAVITNEIPQQADAILGIMLGRAEVDTTKVGTFLPGAMAEHFTSFAAAFDQGAQTKISRWIAAGASASAGTVCEPYAIWPKFTHARFFNHYRMGCTLIESFYLALRSPVQHMLIGDPLTAPWAPFAQMRIAGVQEGEIIREPRQIDLHIRAPRGTHYSRFVYLVNGRIVAEGTQFTLDPAGLPVGEHTLRAVAYRVGFVRNQVFDTVRFRIEP